MNAENFFATRATHGVEEIDPFNVKVPRLAFMRESPSTASTRAPVHTKKKEIAHKIVSNSRNNEHRRRICYATAT